MAAPPAFLTSCPLSTLLTNPPMSHNTTFPFTSTFFKEPGAQMVDESFPFAPAYTSGSNVDVKLLGWKIDSPLNVSPLPSFGIATILLMVLAPTVIIHGASLDKEL